MKKAVALAVAGGDERQVFLARLLHADGHEVSTYALERQILGEPALRVIHEPVRELHTMRAIILPVPVLQGEHHLNAPLSNAPHRIDDFLDALPSGMLVLGGAISPAVRTRAETNGLRLIDYLARDELAIRNAVPTAEGAIQIAMEELPITLHGARVLVVGNGRIGRALSRRLSCLGALVSVSARSNADFARIESNGLTALDTRTLAGNLTDFDAVFNTVPVRVIGLAELSELRPDCLIIDLASKPGGVDLTSAGKLGRKAIWALSLPGKVAPLSAAKAIRDTVYNILREEGIL